MLLDIWIAACKTTASGPTFYSGLIGP